MSDAIDFNGQVDFVVTDALTGDVIEFDYATGSAILERTSGVKPSCTSLFFPGCSFINYGISLVADAYELLRECGQADGISVLCCGKILSYEPDGENVRAAFEEELRQHVAAAGVKRIICACPNCMKAMRDAFALNENTQDIELLALSQVLGRSGYKLDKKNVAKLLKGDENAEVLVSPHDSCPDREYGIFADGLRSMLPDGLWVEPEHCRSKSICCGSLPRAAGKMAQADKCADICGVEAKAVNADAMVTVCMSCTFQLNMAQKHVPCVHLMELFFDHRVDWDNVSQWMKLRFLFNETLGAIDKDSARNFAGLAATESDAAAAQDVTFNDTDVTELGE